jgi:hypothetical protein
MFRSYARFGVVVQLLAAILAGIGAERLWRSGTWRARTACAALLLLAAAEYTVSPAAMSRDVLPTTAHRWVTRLPGPVQALDCAPLTRESASIEWLTGYRISLGRAGFDDCAEPELAGKLAAAGYTHVLVRPGTEAARWLATHPIPDGLQPAARFDDGEVFAVTAKPSPVYTRRLVGFSPREYGDRGTWRWMGSDASWTVVNGHDRPVVAGVDVELSAFRNARRVTILLDGVAVQTLTARAERGVAAIGPLALSPGEHVLTFRPDEAATVADAFLHNGDRRPLSFAVGAWRWTVDEESP